MKLMQFLRRFGREQGGHAALEFAILAPFVMVPLLLGSFDLLDMLQANKRSQNTAASLADVVSRDTSVSDQEVRGLWDAQNVLMYPSNATNMQTRITSVRVVNATTARVVWSVGRNITPYNRDTAITLKPGMMQAGTSVIMTETAFPYTPPLGFLGTGVWNLGHTVYRRSRLVDPIPCEWNGC